MSLVPMLAMALACQPPAQPERTTSLTGHVLEPFTLESKVLGNARSIRVYLPPNYESEPKRRFAVLYMHDGQNVFDGKTSFIPNQEWRADETAEALIDAKLVEPIIIVGIDNAQAERANEYLPTYNAEAKYGGKADLYAKMVVEELKPRIDNSYRTKSEVASTGLMGSSFGGIVTLHMALTRPDVFGKIAVVSPSLWWDDEVMTKRAAAIPAKLPIKVWLDMGAEEGGPGSEYNRMAVGQAQALAKAFRSKGWKDGKDLAVVIEGFAVHNEVAWARRLGAMLMFLFPAKR